MGLASLGGYITKIIVKQDRISGVLEYNPRFFRSVNLQSDFNDPLALKNYVLTSFTAECLNRIAAGLNPNSGQRAWRITGDFGTGKSSFALFLSHWFAGNNKYFPQHLKERIKLPANIINASRYLPVLVNGTREPLSQALAKALSSSLALNHPEERELIRKCEEVRARGTADADILELITYLNSALIKKNKNNGLLIVVDEMGKFLEYAALHPGSQDVLVVQNLAELASRSARNPVFIIGLLHQNIHAYTENLSLTVQREWEKVAARYDEILFEQPFDQITGLISSALALDEKSVSAKTVSESKLALQRVIDLGWFGTVSAKTDLFSNIHKIYPLHPSVLPVLLRIFHRYAQNERSLFTFLLSSEPMGLRNFAENHVLGEYYSLSDLYDYIRLNFGHRLESGAQRNHWTQINSIVDSYSANGSQLTLKVLKTIGILNLLNAEDILATDESVSVALQAFANQNDTRGILKNLRTKDRCLYLRGQKGGYCLWPHSSVNLDEEYNQASRAYPRLPKVADSVRNLLVPRPLVARRHYIETGNFRFFEVRYLTLQDLRTLQLSAESAKEELLVPLCETEEDRAEALMLVKKYKDAAQTLFAVPQTLNLLSGYVLEFQRWDYISTNTKELANDRFASEEVSRRREAARRELIKSIEEFMGFRTIQKIQFSLIYRGKEISLRNATDFVEYISQVFDALYSNAPIIKNELINRVSISSTAASARQRLIDGILENNDKPLLGMDPEKKPPEMSMYLSLLQASGLHALSAESWALQIPRNSADRYNLHPIFDEFMRVIKARPDDKISVKDIFDVVKSPPYGVRDGVLPVFLAIFYVLHKHEIAFYEDNTFLSNLAKEEFQRLIRKPESFQVQYCKIEGVRSDLFKKMFLALGKDKDIGHGTTQLLDLVRPLCIFCAKLPDYVRQTRRLSAHTIAVREAILNARDPLNLVFTDLPRACDVPQIRATDSKKYERADEFITTLKSAMEELQFAYPKLIERLSARLFTQFDLDDLAAQKARGALALRASKTLVGVVEPKLRSFALRLADGNLQSSQWIESVGSNLALQPPTAWRDSDEDLFYSELGQIAAAFRRVESIYFSGDNIPAQVTGIRLAVTHQDGGEKEQVLFLSRAEEKDLLKMKASILDLIKSNPKKGLAAVSQVLWELLPDQIVNKDKNVN